MCGTGATFAALAPELGLAAPVGVHVHRGIVAQTSKVSSCPHFCDAASVLVAVHDRLARPVASAIAEIGSDANPLIRAFCSKII
jgi:hypothetical protein